MRFRDLLHTFLLLLLTATIGYSAWALDEFITIDDFNRGDTLYHGHAWETLTPGNWKLQNKSLRRRLQNVGNGNPITSFPWHWSNGGKTIAPRSGERTPNLPMGMIWHRQWKLTGNFTLRGKFTLHDLAPPQRAEKDGYLGICFGGQSLYETRNFRSRGKSGAGSWMALWHKDGGFGLYDHGRAEKPVNKNSHKQGPKLKAGDTLKIELEVSGSNEKTATVTARWIHADSTQSVVIENVNRRQITEGYLGLTCYGSLDFQVDKIEIAPGNNKLVPLELNELHVCYPLGDTLRLVDGAWHCKFIALFRSDGKKVELRVADSPQPTTGWQSVPVCGSAKIIDNDWRRYTAVIDVCLPTNPAENTLYYTVTKDGVDVTADPRPALPEQGYLGKKTYVGRLPQLKAPYRICTLGGHALHQGGTTLPRAGTYQENWIHGQPTEGAYKYFEDYNFQIVNWDDDVWYLELLFPPPSTDDAYKIITLSIANQTTRWQMMRHWNVINPGDHDYGMDDIKGPEQILVRKFDDLGQDSAYMRRNFNINHHLVQGLEVPVGVTNPKDWRRWKMPNEDFSLIVLESRLWRTSQDTNIWVNGGWGHKRALYDRRDPTRTLLGEEQFAWLQETIRTDSSTLICITGVNCMHPVFNGQLVDPITKQPFAQEDRVAADYAGWCMAGTDRLLELLGSRGGILSVYGDIHLACMVENKHHRVIESSCGPIGRGGSRGLKEGWGVHMKDYDGRDVQIHALYHIKYDSPQLHENKGPPHWNFLEKQFDTRLADPVMTMKIRNIIDPPTAVERGGGFIHRAASSTGRRPASALPALKTLPDAAVRFSRLDGRPIRGTRSLGDGKVQLKALVDVPPGTQILMTSSAAGKAEAQVITTLPLP